MNLNTDREMIIKNAMYDEERDNAPVCQYGFVDLSAAIANGAVPSSISNTEVEYNDIEDPSTILGKPHDIFEAYRMQDYVKSAGKKESNDTE